MTDSTESFVIKEGSLRKKSGKKKKWKKRFFQAIVENGVAKLNVHKSKSEDVSDSISLEKLTRVVAATDVPDAPDDEKDNGVSFEMGTTKFVLIAKTIQERDDWIEKMTYWLNNKTCPPSSKRIRERSKSKPTPIDTSVKKETKVDSPVPQSVSSPFIPPKKEEPATSISNQLNDILLQELKADIKDELTEVFRELIESAVKVEIEKMDSSMQETIMLTKSLKNSHFSLKEFAYKTNASFKELQEEYNKEVPKLNQENEQLNKLLQERTQEIAELKETINKQQEELEKAKQEQTQLLAALNEFKEKSNSEYENLTKKMEEQQSSLDALNATVNLLTSTSSDSTKSIGQQLQEFLNRISQCEERLQGHDDKFNVVKEETDQSFQKHQEAINEINEKLAEHKNIHEKIMNDIASLDEQHKQHTADFQDHKQAYETHVNENKETFADIQSKMDNFTKQFADISELLELIQEEHKEHAELDDQLFKQLQQDLFDTEESITKLYTQKIDQTMQILRREMEEKTDPLQEKLEQHERHFEKVPSIPVVEETNKLMLETQKQIFEMTAYIEQIQQYAEQVKADYQQFKQNVELTLDQARNVFQSETKGVQQQYAKVREEIKSIAKSFQNERRIPSTTQPQPQPPPPVITASEEQKTELAYIKRIIQRESSLKASQMEEIQTKLAELSKEVEDVLNHVLDIENKATTRIGKCEASCVGMIGALRTDIMTKIIEDMKAREERITNLEKQAKYLTDVLGRLDVTMREYEAFIKKYEADMKQKELEFEDKLRRLGDLEKNKGDMEKMTHETLQGVSSKTTQMIEEIEKRTKELLTEAQTKAHQLIESAKEKGEEVDKQQHLILEAFQKIDLYFDKKMEELDKTLDEMKRKESYLEKKEKALAERRKEVSDQIFRYTSKIREANPTRSLTPTVGLRSHLSNFEEKFSTQRAISPLVLENIHSRRLERKSSSPSITLSKPIPKANIRGIFDDVKLERLPQSPLTRLANEMQFSRRSSAPVWPTFKYDKKL